VTSPTATEEANLGCTDNALSALGKIAFYMRDHVQADEIFGHWLSKLPLQNDRIEAKNAIEFLDTMTRNKFAPLMRDLGNTVPRMLKILSDGLTIEMEDSWASQGAKAGGAVVPARHAS